VPTSLSTQRRSLGVSQVTADCNKTVLPLQIMTDENGSSSDQALQITSSRPVVSGNNGVASAPSSGNLPTKAAAQVQKMKDANMKYKNLLKMAKERIEQQEEELKRLRGTALYVVVTHKMSFVCVCVFYTFNITPVLYLFNMSHFSIIPRGSSIGMAAWKFVAFFCLTFDLALSLSLSRTLIGRHADADKIRSENEGNISSSYSNGFAESTSSSADAAVGLDSSGHPSSNTDMGLNTLNWNIVRVCQRIKVDLEVLELNARGLNEEIWALIEYELIDNNYLEGGEAPSNTTTSSMSRRTKRWKKFDTDTDFADFVRRDTGEPLTVPPYSLTPQQSSKVMNDAEKNITQITEEYRRFRVKSEMTRKQMDTQIRELQSNNVETAKRRIEGQVVERELEVARTEHTQLERLRAEMGRQEAQWKEAYEGLLKENEALKSSGSEALVASQWRQRYEACLKEKDEAESKLKMANQRSEDDADRGKFEMKYRDLKESFRLYRKKAKEIFEAQQNGALHNGGAGMSSADMMLKISQNSTEDSKLSYLKNLMVNYFTADPEVRDHMEGAIGTVLNFTADDLSKIEKKKAETGWFY
jgi:hypothetical protein